MVSRSCALGLAVFATRVATAQTTVRGVVYDSLQRSPLAGAVVTIVDARNPATARTFSTNVDGRYEFANVAAGPHLVGFSHPLLDSLGLEIRARRVEIAAIRGSNTTRLDLAIPSARSIPQAICRTSPTDDSTGVIIGHVRSALPDDALSDARLVAQWSELAFARGQLSQTIRERVLTPTPGGWFAICGVPTNTLVVLRASNAGDSSAIIRVEIPATGLLRRDLAVGPSNGGQLRGTIRDAASNSPMPGVQVSIDGTGASTVTGDDGVFRLANLPRGTRVLVARKVGYVPTDQPVDIFSDQSAVVTVTVSLQSLRAMLDTVRTVGRRVYSLGHDGFMQRKARGKSGYFFGPEQIDSLHPFDVTDLMTRVPFTHVERTGFDKIILMPKLFGGHCQPTLFLNGARFSYLTATDLDMIARPGDLLGVEVYTTPALAPPQFADPVSHCGSIVVWTK